MCSSDLGILRGEGEARKPMPRATFAEIEAMIASGEIYGGMIPKVRAAMQGLQGRVREVLIVDGAMPRVLSRALREGGVGTRIVRE